MLEGGGLGPVRYSLPPSLPPFLSLSLSLSLSAVWGGELGVKHVQAFAFTDQGVKHVYKLLLYGCTPCLRAQYHSDGVSFGSRAVCTI